MMIRDSLSNDNHLDMRSLLLLFFILLVAFNAQSREMEVAVGLHKPPYVNSANNSGFEVDLVRAILSDMGHSAKVLYLPYGRTTKVINQGAVDIALTLTPSHAVSPDILSNPYIAYQNVAITRSDRKIRIDSIEALKTMSVVAFQTAISVLGKTFEATLSSQPTYLEMAKQERQVEMLMLGSVDVAVMDRNIFSYFKLNDDRYKYDDVVFHRLFPVSTYRAAIPDEELREAFNHSLSVLIESGRYRLLLEKHGLEWSGSESLFLI